MFKHVSSVSASCSKVMQILNPWSVMLVSTRGARYRPYHQEPILDKEELAKELPSDDPRRYLPIKAAKNDQLPSHLQHPLLIKLINRLMIGGQKELSTRLVLETLENIKRIQVKQWVKAKTDEEKAEIERNPIKVFEGAVENCRPRLNLIPHSRGGTTYMIPAYISENESYFRSMKWIIVAARDKERIVKLPENLTRILMDAYRGEGRAVQRKQEHHRQCEANRAYAHYKSGA